MNRSKFMKLVTFNTMVLLAFSFSVVSGFHILKANTKESIGDAFFDDLDTFDENRWHKAHHWGNGQMFNATWYESQVTFDNGMMTLAIEMDEEGANPPYKAGEYRSNQFYQYGLFEVNMKPGKSEGTVSSFFTYTGPSNDDPWDEIDIEFLGKDTTKIQFNYFTDGIGNNEYMHELGFDASESFHTYAFEWRPNSISWYVDGQLIHTATENIPQTPQQIMMNFWPAIGVDAWTGVFDDTDIPIYTQYNWIKYTPISELDTDTEEDDGSTEETDENEDDTNDEGESTDESDENTNGTSDEEDEATDESGGKIDSPNTEDRSTVQNDDSPSGLNDNEGSTEESDDYVDGTIDENNDEDSVFTVNNDKMNKEKDSSGNRLPDTATPLYTYLLIGVLVFLLGGYWYIRTTRKQRN